MTKKSTNAFSTVALCAVILKNYKKGISKKLQFFEVPKNKIRIYEFGGKINVKVL